MKRYVSIVSRNCEICGKSFVPSYEYVYKIVGSKNKTKWYCSYTCWRKDGGGNGNTKYQRI